MLLVACGRHTEEQSNDVSYNLIYAPFSDSHLRTGRCAFVIGSIEYSRVTELTNLISALPKGAQISFYHSDPPHSGLASAFSLAELDLIVGTCKSNNVRFGLECERDVFVIGEDAYRTIEELLDGISKLPRGSSLHLGGSCTRPFPFTGKDLDAIKRMCESNAVRYVFHPAG
jgi:hypothetical protein